MLYKKMEAITKGGELLAFGEVRFHGEIMSFKRIFATNVGKENLRRLEPILV